MIEIIFYDVMALVAMRIGRKCISGSELFLRLRERVERTRVYVRHFSYSYVSVTCAVRIALINSSFSLFLLFFLHFNSLVYSCIH